MLVDGKKILICLNYIINLIKDIRNHFIKSFLYWMVLKLLEYQISKKVGMAEMVCCFRKIHLKWPHFWANSKCSHGTSIDAQGIFLQKICVFCHHLAIYPIHFSRLRERKIQFRQENCFSMFMWWSLYTRGLVGILSELKRVIWILSKKWGIFTSMTIPKFYFIPSKKTFLFKTWNATLITFIGRFTPIVNI